MQNNTSPVDIAHLAAYAEDPRSYCYYKGVPRSIHNKNQQKRIPRKNLLSSSLSRNLLYFIILCFIFSGICFYFFWNAPVNSAGITIAGITIDTQIILYAGIGSFLLMILLWMIRSFIIRRALFKLCGVPTSSYRLLGTNLIGLKNPIKLKKNKLRGIPSTIFLKKDGKTAYVCQYNPRDFKGKPKVRERYQMLLFMGIALEEYKLGNVKGAIRFHDHLEPINYEPGIYKKLLNLQNEYNEAIQEWVTPDNRPLFSRDKTF